MKTTHTPGPWSLEYDYSLVMPYKRGNYIVTAGPIGPSEADRDELRANARLIAAAPELLETLNALTNLCKFIPKEVFTDNGQKDFQFILTKAGEAIQKATAN